MSKLIVRRQMWTCNDCVTVFTVVFEATEERTTAHGCPFCGNLEVELDRTEDDEVETH